MSSIVGCIFISKDDGKVLFLRRSLDNPTDYYRGYWSFLTGHIDKGELPYQAMERETEEEIGIKKNTFKFTKFDTIKKENGNILYFYYCLVPKEFEPKLNEENIDYMWTDINNLPKPLYPGSKKKIEIVLTLL